LTRAMHTVRQRRAPNVILLVVLTELPGFGGNDPVVDQAEGRHILLSMRARSTAAAAKT
jgi:hypothetical protein